ncbi:unnamed protein product [Cylindrotheca closterium]|uniref:Major facilitator superfamily (MFS) profile domain-containing protein n=1 Tax=Cylindrotheca closterium TaxID=2856 RepID=A0AAD2CIA7_9STRA|nr:unnamed protein product [Cylindrotheca closterium]
MPRRTSSNNDDTSSWRYISPRMAFLMVSMSLGQLGDGLNIFQGIYLVGIGWNESSVGKALSLMGLTALLVQPFAGDFVDRATIDRRVFLTMASIVTAISASTILMVRHGNTDHVLIYASKILEGISSSFIGPCLAALTLASFGPDRFDEVMASNIYWGHVGSVMAAGLAGLVAYMSFPDIKFCFLIIGASALIAIGFVQSLPQGDPLLGRGFRSAEDSDTVTRIDSLSDSETGDNMEKPPSENTPLVGASILEAVVPDMPEAAAYMDVFLDRNTCILCCTGFFFHFANANVLLVLGELMGQEGGGSDTQSRNAIPLTAGAIIMAQVTMAFATQIGDNYTAKGTGRKVLFMAGLLSLPIRCALIIMFSDAGSAFLLSTQIFDGIGGGLMGLIQPLIIADITFGSGRFNAVNGLIASCFGLGATLSNFLGQMVVERYGHIASLTASFFLSIIPILVFSNMTETYGLRGQSRATDSKTQTLSV